MYLFQNYLFLYADGEKLIFDVLDKNNVSIYKNPTNIINVPHIIDENNYLYIYDYTEDKLKIFTFD